MTSLNYFNRSRFSKSKFCKIIAASIYNEKDSFEMANKKPGLTEKQYQGCFKNFDRNSRSLLAKDMQ